MGDDADTDDTSAQRGMEGLGSPEKVPPSVISAAKTSFGWRNVTAAVADLDFDSATEEVSVAPGSPAPARHMRFSREGFSVEITVTRSGQRLGGRFDPPIAGSVRLSRPGRPELAAAVDSKGRFRFEAVGRGPVSIRTISSDPRSRGFQTAWVTI